MTKNKIKNLRGLKAVLGALKRRGKKIVFTNGCFDILHKGHIKLLKKARSLGDVLVVAVNSDSSVRKIKGDKRPINRAPDRAAVLSAVTFVDFVTIFDEPDPEKIIKKLCPDVLVKGADWGKKKIIGGDFVKARGGKVCSVPLAKGYSTSRIIKAAADA